LGDADVAAENWHGDARRAWIWWILWLLEVCTRLLVYASERDGDVDLGNSYGQGTKILAGSRPRGCCKLLQVVLDAVLLRIL
jgi:hypothetical protein